MLACALVGALFVPVAQAENDAATPDAPSTSTTAPSPADSGGVDEDSSANETSESSGESSGGSGSEEGGGAGVGNDRYATDTDGGAEAGGNSGGNSSWGKSSGLLGESDSRGLSGSLRGFGPQDLDEYAEEVYVSSTGTDAVGVNGTGDDYGSRAAPFQTLEFAVEHSATESTIYVMTSLVVSATVVLDESERKVTVSADPELSEVERDALVLSRFVDVDHVPGDEEDATLTGYLFELGYDTELHVADLIVDGGSREGAVSAFSVTGSVLSLTNVTVRNNFATFSATTNGGAITMSGSGARVNIEGGVITGNRAGLNGAAVYNNAGELTLKGDVRIGDEAFPGGQLADNGVYLAASRVIQLDGELGETAHVNVEAKNSAQVGVQVAAYTSGISASDEDLAKLSYRSIAYVLVKDDGGEHGAYALGLGQTDFYVSATDAPQAPQGSDVMEPGRGQEDMPFATLARAMLELPYGEGVSTRVHVMSSLVTNEQINLARGDVTVQPYVDPETSVPREVSVSKREADESNPEDQGFVHAVAVIQKSATLTIKGITFDGRNVRGSSVFSVLGGTLVMESGVITGGFTEQYGGGVSVRASGGAQSVPGTFVMRGGRVVGNTALFRGQEIELYTGVMKVEGDVTIGAPLQYSGVLISNVGSIELTGDLAAEARIYVEGSIDGVTAGSVIATKTGGAPISIAESRLLLWLAAGHKIVPVSTDGTGTTYVLSDSQDLYVSFEDGDDEVGQGTLANPYKTLAKAFQMATGTAIVIVMDTGDPYGVSAVPDADPGNPDLAMTIASELVVDSGDDITLETFEGVNNPLTVIRRDGYAGRLFRVDAGGSLTIQRLSVDGGLDEGALDDYAAHGVASSIAFVNGGGLTLGDDAVFRNNRADLGAAVHITGGAFTLDGGVIEDNRASRTGTGTNGHGGAIYQTNGTFTVKSGRIEDNLAQGNGGAHYQTGGSTLMSGGLVSGNIAELTVMPDDDDPDDGESPEPVTTKGLGQGTWWNGAGSYTLAGDIVYGESYVGNGIYIASTSAVLTQNGDLGEHAWVNVELKTGAVAGTKIIGKTGTATSQSEAEDRWNYQQSVYTINKADANTTDYVLKVGKNLYVASYGSDTTGTGKVNNPLATISYAVSIANPNAASNIIVMDDMLFWSQTVVPSGKTIVITTWSEADNVADADGRATVMRRTDDAGGLYSGEFARVESGGLLTLSDVVVDGAKDGYTGTVASLLRVQVYVPHVNSNVDVANAGLVVGAGATVRNNRAVSGGGVYLYGFVERSRYYSTYQYARASLSLVLAAGGVIEGNEATGNGGGVFFDQTIKGEVNDGNVGPRLTVTTEWRGRVSGNVASGLGQQVWNGLITNSVSGNPVPVANAAQTNFRVYSGARIGGPSDTGGLYMASNLVIQQPGDLDVGSTWVTLEAKVGGVTGTQIVSKTGGSATSAAEGGVYRYRTAPFSVIPGNTAMQYVLGMPTDLYVASWGSDGTADGWGTVAKPFASVRKAVEAAMVGRSHTVHVMDDVLFSAQTVVPASKTITLRTWEHAGQADEDGDPENGVNGATQLGVIADADGRATVMRRTDDAGGLYSGEFARVESGGLLTLSDVVVDGAKDGYTGTVASLLRVQVYVPHVNSNVDVANAGLVVGAGATVRNNRAVSGGGVYLYGFVERSRYYSTYQYARASLSLVLAAGGVIEGNEATGNGGGVFFDQTIKGEVNDGNVGPRLTVTTEWRGRVSGNVASGLGQQVWNGLITNSVSGNPVPVANAAQTNFRVYSGARIGGPSDTGGLYMASNLTLQQPANFNVEDDTWISIENSNALVNGRLIVSKTGGIEALQSESDAFHIPSWTVVPSVSPKGHKLSPGPGAEFFVDAVNGVDAYPNDGADSPGSEGHPFRTLAWAFNHAAVGKTTNVYLLSDMTVPKQLEEYHGRNITVQTASSVLEASDDEPLTVFRAAAHAGHIVNISNSANYTTGLAFKNVVVDGSANPSSAGSVVNAGAPASNAPVVVGFDNATVRGNTGTNGAVLNMGSAYVTATVVNGSVFEHNTATGAGGAVYQTAGSLTVTGSEFTNNAAGSNGGAIYQANGTLTLTDSTVSDNVAGSNGGGVYQAAGTTTFDDVTILGNTVTATAGKGRAVFYGAGSLTLRNTIDIGADDADNGVWIAAAAALTLKQDGDLDPSSRVNLEGKDAAVASDKTVLVNKTGGAEVSATEAELYHWQPVAYWEVVELAPTQYVLGSAPNMYVANGDVGKNEGIDPLLQVPVGSDSTGEGTVDKPFASIQKALSVTREGSDASHYRVSTIHVMDDLPVSPAVGMTADQYKDVTIRAWRDGSKANAPTGEVRAVRDPALTTSCALTTKPNNRMTLTDLTVDGNGLAIDNTCTLVYVNGGEFTLADGGKLTGQRSTGNSGAVYTESKFTMTGGEISGNQSGSDRGIITVPNVAGASVTMSGGVVKDNVSTNATGSVIRVLATGTAVSVTINGSAVIRDNTSSHASSNGGAIFTNTNSSATTVNIGGNAFITGNRVGNAGGAVYQNSGTTLTVSGNAEVAGNQAATGGAVYQANGTLTVRDNVALIDNVATSSVAGVYWAAGTLNVRGNVKIGTDSDRNGIYNARAGVTDAELITQYGDLEATARINLHGKNGATNGTRVVRKVKIDAADPTLEANVTEAAYYDWLADRALDVEPEGSSVYYRVGTGTTNWHVASYGDDAGAGTVADPLKTLPRAFHLVKPGSSSVWSAATVTVMDDISTGSATTLAANSYKRITVTSWDSVDPAVDSGRGDQWVPVADAAGRATVKRAVGNTTNAFVQVNANSELIMNNVIFHGNKANVASTQSLIVVVGGKFTLGLNAVLTQNRGYRGAAISAAETNSTVVIDGGEISYNTATSWGGALTIAHASSSATFKNATVHHNEGAFGGVILGYSYTTVTIADSSFTYNHSTGHGGVIAAETSPKYIITDTIMSNNTAANQGGAMYLYASTQLQMSGGSLSSNTSSNVGGALAISQSSSAALNGVSVASNTATNAGGGFNVLNNGLLTVTGGSVQGNKVTAGRGGGLNHEGTAAVTFDGVSVTGNQAISNGGGVYQDGGPLTFKGATTIQGNTATGGSVGEDVFYNAGTITIQDKPVLGTAGTGMGVYMAKAAVFAQNGDLEDGSLINIENKANAVNGDRLANKSNGGPVDDEEAGFYRFWGAYYWVKADTGLNAYVLGYYSELYVANPDAAKNDGVDPTMQVPVGSDVLGADTGHGTKERPFATIQKAIEIAAPGASGTWKATTIYVMDDLTLSAVILPGSTDGYSHKHITVRAWRDTEDERAKPEGGELTVTRAAAFTGHMIQTHAKSWIDLVDITFSGNKQQISGYHGAVTAYVNGGALGLEQGARLVDSRSTNSGAAYVDNSGHLWMNQGGEISGNESNNVDRSAGVTAGSSGKFTMYGGVLRNNVSSGVRGGAVSVVSGGTFDMQGGSIEANTNTGGWGGGVYVFSGGTMTVSGESGITGNQATNAAGGGGGIAIESSGTGTAAKVTLGGNALISGNATAGVGSAVHWKLGTLTVKDAVRIGVDKKDNGIYIATAANALTQAGSLAHEARINLDGKLNATHLANTKIAGKTGAATSDAEAGQYFYQNRSYRVVRSTQNTTDYILNAVTDFYVSPESGDDAYGLGTFEDPFKSLAKALATTVLDVPTAWHVMDDVVLDAGLVIPARVDATVHQAEQVGGTVHVSRGDEYLGSLFTVVTGGKLAWDDLVMDGKGDVVGEAGSLITVAGGTFNLLGGKLINNIAPEGAAVNVTAGALPGNGVSTPKVYSVTISGGEISGNTATGNGGAINLLEGGLLVSGGVITGNTVSNEETGRGQGVYVNGGEIHITEYPRIGVHDLDNGVYIGYPKLQQNNDGQWAKSVIMLEQGDLHSGSNVNIEGKLDAVEYTIIVDKESSAPATRLESEYFRWQGEGLRLVIDGGKFYSLASVYDYYVSSTGRDDTGNGTQKYPFASIAHAFEVAAEDTAKVPKPVNVHVMDDVVTKRETAVVPAGADITLQKWRMNLQSVSVTRVASFRGDLIRVEEGGTFYMRTLSVDGGEVSNTAPLLLVDGGKAVMVSGTLTGARGGAGMAAGAGSAVVVSGDGEFALHGGNVIGNGSVSDGEDVGIPVVFAAGGARVVMGGGEISGNAVMAGHGAVEFDDTSVFEFYGGLIRANKSYGVVMDGGGFDVWGAPRIEATHGASGIWLAEGQVITVIGDLTRGARLDVSGKGAVTGVSTADRDSVIAVKTGGAPVSRGEARYFRWVPGTLSVIKHESEQWYVLGDLDVQFLAATPDGTAHIADSTGVTLIFQGGDPGIGMEHLTVKRNGTLDLAASGALQYLGLDEGDLDDPDDDTWRYRIPIDHTSEQANSTWDEGDTVTVTATKLGVVFDPQSRTGMLHRDDRIRVEYVDAVADGEVKTVKSSTLTLTFDREIPLLSTADITLTPQTPYADADVNKGALSGPVSRIVDGETVFDYTLGISGDWYEGDKVDVEVDKWGYLFTPGTRTATLHATKVRTEHEYVQVSANGTANALNTTVLTLYMKVAEVADIADLVAADITVTGRAGSSATLDVDVESVGAPVAYTGAEPSLAGSYEYAATITGTWIEGDEVDVQVGKSGYLFTPNVRDTVLHRGIAVLDAYDFGIPMSKLNTFSKEEARRRARATATDDLQQPIDIDDIMVDDDEFTALTDASEEGPYDLTFSILDATPSESETETISVLVYDDSLAAVGKRVINDPERDGYDLGAPVEFELAARIPDLYGIAMPMDDYTYGLVDTLPAELSLPDEDDVEVYVADSTVDVSDQVNVSVDSGARTISVEGLAGLFAQKNDTNDITDIPGVVAGTDLCIRFTSVLGTGAQVSTPDSLSATVNTATLTQSTGNPEDLTETDESIATTSVHSFGVEAFKADMNDVSQGLQGATFTITRAKADDPEVMESLQFMAVNDGTDGVYRLAVTADSAPLAEVTSGTDGTLRLLGLEARELTFKETAAPDGFFTIKDFTLDISPQWQAQTGTLLAVGYGIEGSQLVTVDADESRVTIANPSATVAHLPYTGSYPILMLLLIGTMITLIGMVIYHRKTTRFPYGILTGMGAHRKHTPAHAKWYRSKRGALRHCD
jgi:hypothetical protein